MLYNFDLDFVLYARRVANVYSSYPRRKRFYYCITGAPHHKSMNVVRVPVLYNAQACIPLNEKYYVLS
jgi:hypothetical protein